MSVVRESRKYHYRKIYEEYYQCSLLPGVEIHHIDGDHTNDDPLNLQAVSLQEHYDIHYSQNDYNACRLMKLQRMDYNSEEISKLASEGATQRVKDGTLPN